MTDRPTNADKRESIGLPPRPFFYYLDQISTLTSISMKQLEGMLYYDGRTLGIKKASQLMVRNLGTPGQDPIWRVAEHEFIRWLKAHHIRVHERISIQR